MALVKLSLMSVASGDLEEWDGAVTVPGCRGAIAGSPIRLFSFDEHVTPFPTMAADTAQNDMVQNPLAR